MWVMNSKSHLIYIYAEHMQEITIIDVLNSYVQGAFCGALKMRSITSLGSPMSVVIT